MYDIAFRNSSQTGTDPVAYTPVSATNPLPVRRPEDGSTLTKSSVAMTGVSATLLAADPTRKIVIVASAASNSAAAIDPTGGAASLTAGIPLAAGGMIEIVGNAAQSAMTQIGTNTQTLTVYTG